MTFNNHAALLNSILSEFLPRIVSAGTVQYVADKEWRRHHQEQVDILGLTTKTLRRMPDVLISQQSQQRLLMVDAFTGHGVITDIRRRELLQMYAQPSIDLVFVTAFPSRITMAEFGAEIAWGTDAWLADEPSHLIHFNGDKFLGPYA